MALIRRAGPFYVIAVFALVAVAAAALWLFLAPLFWGLGALFFCFLEPISMYLYISRWRERTIAVWQNNWWGPGLIKLILQNVWFVVQLLLGVRWFAESINQLTGLVPPDHSPWIWDDSLNVWVLVGVIAYCSVAAIVLPRMWPLLYNSGLVSTPALRDVVRYSWESRPSST